MLGLTTLLCSILLGSMVFFVGIVLRSIHKVLDGGKALTLTRQLFPQYYLWGLGLSVLATGFFDRSRDVSLHFADCRLCRISLQSSDSAAKNIIGQRQLAYE